MLELLAQGLFLRVGWVRGYEVQQVGREKDGERGQCLKANFTSLAQGIKH